MTMVLDHKASVGLCGNGFSLVRQVGSRFREQANQRLNFDGLSRTWNMILCPFQISPYLL